MKQPYFHSTRDGLIALFIGALLFVATYAFGYVNGATSK